MRQFLINSILSIYRKVGIIQLIYRPIRTMCSKYRLKRLIRQKLANREPIKIVLGAKKKFQKDWIPTEIYSLNILKPEDWRRYFPKESIDALLAEHVWEHMTKEESIFAAKMCFKYLKPNGYLRIAVPDGLFPDTRYIDFVKPGGIGPSAKNHKTLYTYKTLKEIFESAGFGVDLLEFYDEKNKFCYKEWDPDDGMIIRSKRFYDGHIFGKFKYSSIILDAKKHG